MEDEFYKEIGIEEPIPKDPRGTVESTLGDEEFMIKGSRVYKIIYTNPGIPRSV